MLSVAIVIYTSCNGVEPTAVVTSSAASTTLQHSQSTNLTCKGTAPACTVTKVGWTNPDGEPINTAREQMLNSGLESSIEVKGIEGGGQYSCNITYSGGSVTKVYEIKG